MADLEYPRWEHHDDFASELVNDEDERAALFARWEAGKGKPKSRKLPTSLTPVPKPAAAPAVDLADAKPQFMVYDVSEDANVPLTQERLDDLLFAEEMMSILWPAAQRDAKAEAAFPPELARAVEKVKTLISARQVPTEITEAVPKPRRGRPPKPKDEQKAA